MFCPRKKRSRLFCVVSVFVGVLDGFRSFWESSRLLTFFRLSSCSCKFHVDSLRLSKCVQVALGFHLTLSGC